MKKSIFSDIDSIIEAAVNHATAAEEDLQKKQSGRTKAAGLIATKKTDDVDEGEGDEPKETDQKDKEDDESAKKITGAGAEKDKITTPSVKPGTRTSKKLSDPPEKVLLNPQFSDIQQKINTLRGASSLRKEPISVSVQQYLKTLTVPEKAALLTYLTNLSQIMAPVKKPDEVNEPSEVGISTSFKGRKTQPKSQPEEKKEEEKSKKSDKSGVVVVGED